jgi:hypothetical protein
MSQTASQSGQDATLSRSHHHSQCLMKNSFVLSKQNMTMAHTSDAASSSRQPRTEHNKPNTNSPPPICFL